MIYIPIAIAICILILVIFIATRPAKFRVERSITISAPPEKPFDLVNDLRAWKTWSPFEKYDPNLKKTFSEPAVGTGATYAWSGNNRAGEGTMTIEKSDRPSVISTRLQFSRPFKAINMATFTFTPAENETKVTWAMDGNNNFMGKAFSTFVNMDKMLGGEFNEGLTSLKRVVEKGS